MKVADIRKLSTSELTVESTKLREEIKKTFGRCEAVKPDSTRKISKEIFLVGIGKKSL